MKIGVPKEIKIHEYRVGLTPASVRELVSRGHEVVVQRRAGESRRAPSNELGNAALGQCHSQAALGTVVSALYSAGCNQAK